MPPWLWGREERASLRARERESERARKRESERERKREGEGARGRERERARERERERALGFSGENSSPVFCGHVRTRENLSSSIVDT